ncbi:polysaccharide deacetylase family protein [Streptomyces pluripotens]|uniref:Polysaccharide deacetylase family protein n=1 Tax=Streptomyces pluripotens TaxID=1355015 RepID=A0A221P3I3_9ACTN|nr:MULTISPECIES: polysaccharide deacetylase family protein [Streptomyces]ARP72445.1 polysaccharide deacetylase [Streptomyces pluripotens]ASN26694.1 polysaccharide deacetylase family protein [Streptomyces pluripotens]KIE26134.1 polysaccharide deacetylase [Streptomyces sp. MUSC 125]MCH0559588.1 polysaccharide deacetylase family protein [Streptomyces sp. MUM 16J]
MVRVTTINRRGVLRTGAGLVAGGALAAGCGSGPAAPPTTPTPPSAPGSSPAARAAPAPRGYPGQPVQISHGPRTRAQVALTFHGQGDPGLAHSLLGVAEELGARLTVLAVGTWLDEHPGIARRILDGGHDLGNHTQRHISVNALAEPDARKEITECADRLKRLTGSIGTWFRPSRAPTASPLVARLARAAGYPHVLSYDVDSLDYTRPGAAAVTRNVLADVRHGSVVSLHFGYQDTVAALPDVLHELGRRGLRAVTTTELLS